MKWCYSMRERERDGKSKREVSVWIIKRPITRLLWDDRCSRGSSRKMNVGQAVRDHPCRTEWGVRACPKRGRIKAIRRWVGNYNTGAHTFFLSLITVTVLSLARKRQKEHQLTTMVHLPINDTPYSGIRFNWILIPKSKICIHIYIYIY